MLLMLSLQLNAQLSATCKDSSVRMLVCEELFPSLGYYSRRIFILASQDNLAC